MGQSKNMRRNRQLNTALQEAEKEKGTALFDGDNFEKIMTILMAVVTVIISVIALLQGSDGTKAALAKTQAQQYAMNTMGLKATGQVQAGYAWTDAYQHWIQWDAKAEQAKLAQDAASAKRYEAVRDQVTELSPLLKKPYFEPTTKEIPDIAAFEATNYVISATLMTEKFIDAVRLDGEYGDKEDAYNAQQLLLAMTMFLYGLSTTTSGRIKWLFVVIGTLMANFSLIWMIVVSLKVVSPRPDEVMIKYATGVGKAYQNDLKGAITDLDASLSLAPDYANAYYVRANTQYKLGNFEQAVADYQAAQDNGREDVNVLWNKGWVYYISGQYAESTETTKAALEMDSNQVALYFNLALAHLAAGEMEDAQRVYQQGFDLAVKQVTEAKDAGQDPPASLWWYLGAAATDLDSFLTCIATKECKNSPSAKMITAKPDALQKTGRDIRRQLKDVSVGLEYLGKLPSDKIAAAITELKFATASYDESGKQIGLLPLRSPDKKILSSMVQEEKGQQMDKNLMRVPSNRAKPIFTIFNYKGMTKGKLLVIKLYNKDNEEATELRLAQAWDLSDSGDATLPILLGKQFTLVPGEYRTEIYVDGHLLQEGGFIVPQN